MLRTIELRAILVDKITGQKSEVSKIVEYTFKPIRRSRAIRVTIRPGGICTVTAPIRVSEHVVHTFLIEKSGWILTKIAEQKLVKPPLKKADERKEYLLHKESARKIAEEKVRYFNQHYKFKWNKIAIRNQKTRWGSCSRKGNLNFSFKIALLPESLADYLVVHEVCHLGQFNHSDKFWKLVEQTIPDYKKRRNQLKRFGGSVT